MGAEGPLDGAQAIRSGQGGTQGMGGSQDGGECWAAHREHPPKKAAVDYHGKRRPGLHDLLVEHRGPQTSSPQPVWPLKRAPPWTKGCSRGCISVGTA